MPDKIPELKIRLNTHDVLTVKPGENEPGGWVRSPAQTSLFTSVEKALITVAKLRGQEMARVDFIRVANGEGDARVWLYPTDETDPDRLKLRRYGSRLCVNLSPVFKTWKLTLPPGQRRRYDLLIDPDGPVGPALWFNVEKPLEVRGTGKGKSEPSAPRQESPARQSAPAQQPAPGSRGDQENQP